MREKALGILSESTISGSERCFLRQLIVTSIKLRCFFHFIWFGQPLSHLCRSKALGGHHLQLDKSANSLRKNESSSFARSSGIDCVFFLFWGAKCYASDLIPGYGNVPWCDRKPATRSFVDSCCFGWVHLICRSLLVITIYHEYGRPEWPHQICLIRFIRALCFKYAAPQQMNVRFM